MVKRKGHSVQVCQDFEGRMVPGIRGQTILACRSPQKTNQTTGLRRTTLLDPRVRVAQNVTLLESIRKWTWTLRLCGAAIIRFQLVTRFPPYFRLDLMALVPLRVVLDHAAENDYGVAAFNVNNMEQIQAIMEAAEETDSPVIIQASRGARAYSQDAYLRHLMVAATELYPHIPIVMHQDHGNSPSTCQSAIDNGFTSVMMDGSLEEDGKTPADFDYNVRVTAEVVKLAHAQGVSVEGELGCLGSLESGEGEQEDGPGAVGELSREQLLTDPDEAARFVEETGVDALAVAIGTSHGAYKFTSKPTGEVLAMTRIEEMQNFPTLTW